MCFICSRHVGQLTLPAALEAHTYTTSATACYTAPPPAPTPTPGPNPRPKHDPNPRPHPSTFQSEPSNSNPQIRTPAPQPSPLSRTPPPTPNPNPNPTLTHTHTHTTRTPQYLPPGAPRRYVVSVNWSAEMVKAALSQEGLSVVIAGGRRGAAGARLRPRPCFAFAAPCRVPYAF